MQVSCGSERVHKNIGTNNKAEMLNEFAKIFPSIRKTLGVSQSELGKRIGVSRQSISSIERKCGANLEHNACNNVSSVG